MHSSPLSTKYMGWACASILAAASILVCPCSSWSSAPCKEGFHSSVKKIHPDILLHEQSCAKPLYRSLALEVDLTSPRLSFVVNQESDGRMTTSEFTEKYSVFAAVNGGYRGPEGGFTVTSGQMWSGNGDTKVGTVLGFGGYRVDDGRHRVEIRPPEEQLTQVPPWMQYALTGRPLVLEKGQNVYTHDHRYINRHPRTAAGLSDDRETLYLVTVDGRQEDWSMGLTISKLGDMFRQLGATRVVNLDGGGSTTMVVPSQGGRLNHTCARNGKEERPVLNHLGIRVSSFDWDWPVMMPAFAPPSSWFVEGPWEI